ncbi:5185_t:CDS:2 [Racocetra fulgida]|uniref:5185_t:CDS:1 n=1 Tax=Racocetra fulgida TaxID=60492 RepID=A0A9N8Z2G9_9GLOM|nr:5185_t:CDS:2 [Racocetra fulgida]
MSTSVNQFNFTGDNNSDGAGEKDNGNAPAKRKRLTQACDACRKKKVKCIGLVESLEKRLQQMEKLLQPLKEQGLVDDSDDQSLSPLTKKSRVNSTDSNTSNDDLDDQLTSEPNSSAASTIPRFQQQSREFMASTSKTQASTPLPQFNRPGPSSHNVQAESIDAFSQPLRPQQNQLRNKNGESIKDDRNSSNSPHIKLEESCDYLFFGNTAVHPGYKKRCPQMPSSVILQSHIQSSVVFVSNGLPTEDIVEHLALCYFRHRGGSLSMFHQHTFMRRLRQNKISPFLILAMREPPYLAGEPYATQASKFILESLDIGCIEHVQGLHRVDETTSNSSPDSKLSEDAFITKEMKRRRVCTYVNRPRPTNALPPWDPSSEFTLLQNELELWYQSILPHYVYSREKMVELMAVEMSGVFAAIHLFYQAAVVVLNRSVIKSRKNETITTIPTEFYRLSFERCYNAAKQVGSVAFDILKIGCPCACPFTTYPMYVTATIYINHMKNEDITVFNVTKENLKIIEQYLEEVGKLWATANKLRCVLDSMKKDQGLSETLEKRYSPNLSETSDAGLMAYWNNSINATDVNIINNTSMNAFPDQILSSRWLYGNMEHPFMGDTWTNFLRSPTVSPGLIRRFSRSNESGENTNEEGLFPQNMTLYNNNPYAYDYSMVTDMSNGQPFSEWSAGRIMSNRRNLVDMGEMGSIVPSSSVNIHGSPAASQLLNPTIGSTLDALEMSNVELMNKGYMTSISKKFENDGFKN